MCVSLFVCGEKETESKKLIVKGYANNNYDLIVAVIFSNTSGADTCHCNGTILERLNNISCTASFN